MNKGTQTQTKKAFNSSDSPVASYAAGGSSDGGYQDNYTNAFNQMQASNGSPLRISAYKGNQGQTFYNYIGASAPAQSQPIPAAAQAPGAQVTANTVNGQQTTSAANASSANSSNPIGSDVGGGGDVGSNRGASADNGGGGLGSPSPTGGSGMSISRVSAAESALRQAADALPSIPGGVVTGAGFISPLAAGVMSLINGAKSMFGSPSEPTHAMDNSPNNSNLGIDSAGNFSGMPGSTGPGVNNTMSRSDIDTLVNSPEVSLGGPTGGTLSGVSADAAAAASSDAAHGWGGAGSGGGISGGGDPVGGGEGGTSGGAPGGGDSSHYAGGGMVGGFMMHPEVHQAIQNGPLGQLPTQAAPQAALQGQNRTTPTLPAQAAPRATAAVGGTTQPTLPAQAAPRAVSALGSAPHMSVGGDAGTSANIGQGGGFKGGGLVSNDAYTSQATDSANSQETPDAFPQDQGTATSQRTAGYAQGGLSDAQTNNGTPNAVSYGLGGPVVDPSAQAQQGGSPPGDPTAPDNSQVSAMTQPAGATKDDQPAKLSKGEYVMDAATVAFFGVSKLKQMQNTAHKALMQEAQAQQQNQQQPPGQGLGSPPQQAQAQPTPPMPQGPPPSQVPNATEQRIQATDSPKANPMGLMGI